MRNIAIITHHLSKLTDWLQLIIICNHECFACTTYSNTSSERNQNRCTSFRKRL